MRKQILLVILLFLNILVRSQDTIVVIDTAYQPSPQLVDDSPAGLGILIGDNQNYLKGNRQDILISQPTIIEAKKTKGVFYIKAYVNNDYFNIIATRITSSNSKNYKAFRQDSWSESIPQPDSRWAIEIPFTIREDFALLETPNINNDKIDGRNFLFYIKDVKTDQIISSLVLEFVYPKPEPQLLSIDEETINYGEAHPNATIYFPLNDIKKQISKKNLVVSKFNAQTNLTDRLVLPHRHNSFLLQFKALKIGAINHFEYKLIDDSTWKSWGKSEYPFIILRDIKPGKHTLQVRYPGQDSGVFEYEFEVRPSWYQTTTFKILLGSFFTVFFFGSIFIVKYRRQQQKLRTENANRKQLQTQIAALRAQLNPHFVFNALNSIQGLVNKNDKEGANLYISKFGSLMRDILEQRDKTTHALAQEIKQLESYLQLEQLRFQFKYKIDTEDSINLVETDFPNLLLQPFVENAIKHGISGKKEKGCIHIRFERNIDNLKVIIQDNGSGFNPAEPSNGYGISLIKERIAVLNQLYKNQPITYEIQSKTTAGTTVTLTFTKWL